MVTGYPRPERRPLVKGQRIVIVVRRKGLVPLVAGFRGSTRVLGGSQSAPDSTVVHAVELVHKHNFTSLEHTLLLHWRTVFAKKLVLVQKLAFERGDVGCSLAVPR